MIRVLCLDVGTKRIGIAISDPLGIIASPIPAISRTPEKKAIDNIKNLCKNYNAKTIRRRLAKAHERHNRHSGGRLYELCKEF